MDYFPKDYLLIIDEIARDDAADPGDVLRATATARRCWWITASGCRRRWTTGRCGSRNSQAMWNQVLFVSATPGKYELELTGGEVVEQVIRPTGLVDPQIEVRPATGQVPDLVAETQEAGGGGRADAGDDADQAAGGGSVACTWRRRGCACKYLHSEIETLDRVEILRELREGEFDVLVGVNLLREGLDLPEVSLVAILDADKAGVFAERDVADPDDRAVRRGT